MLTYWAVVWWSQIYQTTTTHSLNQIQRTVCLLVTEAIETTPTNSIEFLLCRTPNYFYIKLVALMIKVHPRAVGIETSVVGS